MKEVWRQIKNCPIYEVSNMGRVRSWARSTKKPLLMRLHRVESGYDLIQLSIYSTKKDFYVHRLVLEAFVDLSPKNFVGNHKDGNKTNNNVSNLEWISRSDDLNHAYRLGLHIAPDMKGEKHPKAKLKENDVKVIKGLIIRGIRHSEIAKSFKVSVGCIHKISSGENWKHISIKEPRDDESGSE